VTDAPRLPAELVGWLVARHAWLAPILEGHLRDNAGELLPHVLFADLTWHAADLARRAGDDALADDDLRGLLADLDAALLLVSDDDPVDNVIWVSFVENAQGVPGDSEEALRDRLRSFPNLARALSYSEGA
jgi:hypothetical protein